MDNLLITHTELRTISSDDIEPYICHRRVEKIVIGDNVATDELRMATTIPKRFSGFENCHGSFLVVQSIRHFCSLAPKMGLKWTYRRLRVTQMAGFDFAGNY